MSGAWLRNYLLLALRLDKAPRAISAHSQLVDFYCGPLELPALVEAQGSRAPASLFADATTLLDTLGDEGFDAQRERYLASHTLALETVCRRLSGESLTLDEETRRCYCATANWIPEETFDRAWVEAEALLPGTGTVEERITRVRQYYRLPQARNREGLATLEQALVEAQQRTLARFGLPIGEEVTVVPVMGQAWGANAHYQGGLTTEIEVNLDLPLNVRMFLETACHEGYPGHHTQYVWREQYLYREQGLLEHTLGLLLGPQMLLDEGMAKTAASLIFAEGEREHWLAEQVYAPLGFEDNPQSYCVGPSLTAVCNNVVFLLRDGASMEDAARYLQRYLHIPPERAQRHLARITQPLRDTYALTYTTGQRLVDNWMRGEERVARFQRYLHGQLLPDDLL